jgi:hypothetical protein
MIDTNALEGYRRAIARRGESVTFQRITGQAPNVTVLPAGGGATVQAIVTHYQPTSPIGGFAGPDAITEGDRSIIVLSDDLTAAGFPLPLQKNDKVVVQGELMNIERVDPSTRGIAGAWELVALGVR